MALILVLQTRASGRCDPCQCGGICQECWENRLRGLLNDIKQNEGLCCHASRGVELEPVGSPALSHVHTSVRGGCMLLAGEWGGARADLLASSLEGCQIAGAHGDPRKDRHQEPRRAGNKSDPFFALSSPAFCPGPLPPSSRCPSPPLPFFFFFGFLLTELFLSYPLMAPSTGSLSPPKSLVVFCRTFVSGRFHHETPLGITQPRQTAAGQSKRAGPTCQHVNRITNRRPVTSARQQIAIRTPTRG